MSDNRFQNCHTVAQALRRYRDMEMVDADDDFELTVRLYQLAPKVPRTVTIEQRERAVLVVMAAMREAQERGTDILSGNRWLDRIIDALGWTAPEPDPAVHGIGCGCLSCLERVGIKLSEPTPAPATPPSIVTEEQRERFNRVWGELYTVSPPLYSEFHQLIAALGATPAESPTAPTGDGRAVELDLTALDHIRGVLARYENLRAAMVDQPMFGDMPDITIPGDLPMRITMDDNGVSVLRIGGCDE